MLCFVLPFLVKESLAGMEGDYLPQMRVFSSAILFCLKNDVTIIFYNFEIYRSPVFFKTNNLTLI